MSKPTINEMTMWEKHNYVSFSDTDSQRDYFNGYCLGVKQTIEWIERDGGSTIIVRFGNGMNCDKYRKRLQQLCRKCGYEFEERREEVQSPNGEKWANLWFVLTSIVSASDKAEVGYFRDATLSVEGSVL